MGFKLLITGGGSSLRDGLLSHLEERPFIVFVPDFEKLKLLDQESVASYFSAQYPNLVILLCDPNLDSREGLPPVGQTRMLVEECKARNIPLISMSSHRVFGEGCETALCEDTEPEPKADNDDAQGWLEHEKLIAQVSDHILLRLSWLLDGGQSSLLSQLNEAIRLPIEKSKGFSGKAKVSAITQATLVNALIALIHQVLSGAENWGVFHLSSADVGTEYEIANRLREVLIQSEEGLASLGAESDEFFLSGAGNLKGEKLTLNFGIQQSSWRSGFSGLVEKEFGEKE